MRDITIEYSSNTVIKRALTNRGVARIAQEQQVYTHAASLEYIPSVIKSTKEAIELELVKGKNLQDVLTAGKETWPTAKPLLEQYVNAEMGLLNRGVLYRDLNAQHLIFTDKGATLLDLESCVMRANDGYFYQNDSRGTWETMAPEEFVFSTRLSDRTATYRVAVVAHLLLTAELPFRHDPKSRTRTHAWRKTHPALINQRLPKSVRKVLSAALSRAPERRHKDPGNFLMALGQAYEL